MQVKKRKKLTVLRSSSLVDTPFNISNLSWGFSGHGYNVALDLKHNNIHLSKNVINTYQWKRFKSVIPGRHAEADRVLKPTWASVSYQDGLLFIIMLLIWEVHRTLPKCLYSQSTSGDMGILIHSYWLEQHCIWSCQ